MHRRIFLWMTPRFAAEAGISRDGQPEEIAAMMAFLASRHQGWSRSAARPATTHASGYLAALFTW